MNRTLYFILMLICGVMFYFEVNHSFFSFFIGLNIGGSLYCWHKNIKKPAIDKLALLWLNITILGIIGANQMPEIISIINALVFGFLSLILMFVIWWQSTKS